jgi:hypothetical protein
LYAQENKKIQRNYMLVFDIKEYSAQLKDALTSFFKEVLKPGDQLIVVTPTRFIGFTAQKLATMKTQLIPSILDQLKNDISMSAVKYLTTMQEMLRIVQSMSGVDSSSGLSVKESLVTYGQLRQSLQVLRQGLEAKLLSYIDVFRRVQGENHLLMFFEQEFRPIPDDKTMGNLRSNASVAFDAAEVFVAEQYKSSGLDFQKLVAGFKYAKVRFHFLYLQAKSTKTRRGVDYVENSGDIYDVFSKLAKATGGIRTTSAKTSTFVKQVDEVVEGKVEVEVVDETMGEEKEGEGKEETKK